MSKTKCGQATAPDCSAAVAYVPWHKWETLYGADDALRRGTIFPTLDLPLAKPGRMEHDDNRRRRMMRSLQAADFAAFDIQLFIDTHPGCPSARDSLKAHLARRQAALNTYEAEYGALGQFGPNAGMSAHWMARPWPWELEA